MVISFIFGMMQSKKTIVLVLRSGGDYKFRDVELIVWHILNKWESVEKPRIILLWDKASSNYNLGNLEIIPLKTDLPGTWSRMVLYSPEMDQYRPFLYLDLDTAIIQSVEKIFALVTDFNQFIVLEDLWQGAGKIATPVVWFPANSNKTKRVWDMRNTLVPGFRMDYFLRRVTTADNYWQRLTSSIRDFKPGQTLLMKEIPDNTNLVCFHGKPRIFDAFYIKWVKDYINAWDCREEEENPLVTVIIPYNKDRGWLQEAINSVPKNVQLLLSKGDGNWPENFNKVLSLAKGKYIRWLHEDDMLTPNGIDDLVKAIEEQGVDFVHGNIIDLSRQRKMARPWAPNLLHPTLQDLLVKNTLHCESMLYKREVFEKLGGLDETLNVMEEYEFNLRCLKAGFKLGYCSATVAVYRRHDQQKVRVTPKIEKDKERQMVKQMYQ
jgi:hypothetical protein